MLFTLIASLSYLLSWSHLCKAQSWELWLCYKQGTFLSMQPLKYASVTTATPLLYYRFYCSFSVLHCISSSPAFLFASVSFPDDFHFIYFSFFSYLKRDFSGSHRS